MSFAVCFLAHAELGRGWAMLQELYGLYLAADEVEAMAALDRFADLYAADPLPEFYKVVDTLWPGRRRSSCLAQDRPDQQRPDGGHQQQVRRPQANIGVRLHKTPRILPPVAYCSVPALAHKHAQTQQGSEARRGLDRGGPISGR